jgi:hypothetical protein
MGSGYPLTEEGAAMGRLSAGVLGALTGFVLGLLVYVLLDNVGRAPLSGSDELGLHHELGPLLLGVLGAAAGFVVGRLLRPRPAS